jgi:CRP-like cAMP-binding protein/Fe-S-cluster-containing hydrogenase component 2/thioredoxin reductase
MGEAVKVAVIGAGPGGLSAAAHAAELGVSHVLLEAGPALANTIQRYQKGKHVMAEPAALPLRSPLAFGAGTREAVLAGWDQGVARHRVNVRYQSAVVAVSGQRPRFELRLADGATLKAENVVLGIGLQGNPRRLDVPGEDLAGVQYTLDDPEAFRDEAIVVVGAGDAAIENALALARTNKVFLVNRGEEFSRTKEANQAAILKAIDAGQVECFYRASCARVEAGAPDAPPLVLVLRTDAGEARVPCHRVIARLGATPPRKFVESCGIRFPSPDPAALPVLSEHYESSVPGLYVIGALAGYPLIKQAMNQGYEVVEYLLGRAIEPADHDLLAARFRGLPFGLGVNATLRLIQERIPLFRRVNPLVFRELILGSEVLAVPAGTVIFRRNDYTNTFFTVLDGTVEVELPAAAGAAARRLSLRTGEFFGEMSLLSGRRRSATVLAGPGCVLIESPRREINRLLSSDESVRRTLDQHFIVRTIQSTFAPRSGVAELAALAEAASLRRFRPDEVLFREGDEADALHLIRSGSVAVSRVLGGREVVTSYVAAGNYVGEMSLIARTRRSATVRATTATETVSVDAATFEALLASNPDLRAQVQEVVRQRLDANVEMTSQPRAGDLISFFMQQGLGEATDVLLIDETLCVRCDNCEKACAETHGGTSRLDREAGPSFAMVHVPTSCRHCEDPHCMRDCPPDAITRAPNGEVYIRDNCIGCGNCEHNCPYGVIQMAAEAPAKPGLWSWLLFGAGPGPGEDPAARHDKDAPKKAVKCDMCKDLAGGPACVRACPTGAAIRISPEKFVQLARSPEP